MFGRAAASPQPSSVHSFTNACGEDTKSESETEHQASGASSSAMDKKTFLDKEEFLEYYDAEVGENLWGASQVDSSIAINAKYQVVCWLQLLNLEATPRILRSETFYYWARWTMIAMALESEIARKTCNDACNEDTKSESDTSDTEHQASGASSSAMDAMDKKTSLDKEELVKYYGAEVGEKLWRASKADSADSLIAINAKYHWVSQWQCLNLEATPRTWTKWTNVIFYIFYYWARWTMIAMRRKIILNAWNEDTESESDTEHLSTEHQASGASRPHYGYINMWTMD